MHHGGHHKYIWNVIALQEKSQSGIRKLNPSLLCFGQNTTNIFEAFQVFTVFPD